MRQRLVFLPLGRELDRRVGVVMDGLRSAGLHENTLVIATTDHGIAFPRMKCNLEDSGTGTFLILRAGREIANGAFTSGQVVDAMTAVRNVAKLEGVWLETKEEPG